MLGLFLPLSGVSHIIHQEKQLDLLSLHIQLWPSREEHGLLSQTEAGDWAYLIVEVARFGFTSSDRLLS